MTTLVVPARRRGPRHWFGSFRLMALWELIRMRGAIRIAILIQAFTGAGIVLGIGILMGDPGTTRILYLSTGAVTVTLVTLGMVVGPQIIGQLRVSGQYDYMASLPVPASATAAGWIAVNLIIGLPGAIAALVAAWLRYSAQFEMSLLLIPATALTVLTAALIGYAYGMAIANARLVQLVSQVVIFVVIGFSPISFPAENLPDWLATLHRYLPFEAMATVMRAGLTNGLVTEVTRAFVVLAVWMLVATVVTGRAMRRRP